jgi:small subunit ribosomal protein S6e
MTEFVLTINAKDGKSYKKEVSGAEADSLLNKKIRDNVKGDTLGLKGYELKVTGGSDNNGFPIREDIIPGTRKKPLVVSGTGAKFKFKGVKQRKTVRGNIIDNNIKQINLKVEKEGTKKLEEIFGNPDAVEKEVSSEKNEVKEEKSVELVKENIKEVKKDEGKESEESEK